MWGRVLAGAGAIALALALALALAWMHGNARYDAGKSAEAARWQGVVAAKERQIADLRVASESRVTAAVSTFADRIAAMRPVIVRATDTVTKYAQSPDGAALCLPAERVLGIDADAAAFGLYSAERAVGADRPVPAHPDPTQR